MLKHDLRVHCILWRSSIVPRSEVVILRAELSLSDQSDRLCWSQHAAPCRDALRHRRRMGFGQVELELAPFASLAVSKSQFKFPSQGAQIARGFPGRT